MAADEAMPNDVGQWGEKDVTGAYSKPLTIAGEKVDVSKLPPFGSSEESKRSGKTPAPTRRSRG